MATTNPPHIVVSGVSTGAPVAQTSATTEDAPESKLAVESQMMSDFMFGGSILVVVVMFHAFATRYITSVFLRRSQTLTAHAAPWRADLLFALTLTSLLSVHLVEILIWTAALVYADVVRDWSKAAYFASNCYTALGEPFSLPRAWRLVPPIMAISGIFTFAWTASLLVDFVSRYNDLRAAILARHRKPPADQK